MKRNLFLSTIVSASTLLFGCGAGLAPEVQSQWSDSAAVLDGYADDWSGFPLEYSQAEGISLGVRNDAENIYFIFLVRDEQMVRKIQMAGVTIWFDTTGGKKKEFGIGYRGSVDLMESLQKESSFMKSMPPEQKARFDEMQPEMVGMITVIKKGEELSMPESRPKGPAAASACLDGIFGYEFRIPVATGDSISYTLAASPAEMMSVGLEVGGMSRGDREGMMREGPQMGGPPDAGMKGGGGRRMPGGGPPRGRSKGDMKKMMENQEVWLTLRLAQDPHSELQED
jgi:hypothetical protein